MKIILIILLTFNSYSFDFEEASSFLRQNQFLFNDDLSGENDEIYSIVYHAIHKEDQTISNGQRARDIIQKDLNELNSNAGYINSCKNHINSKSLITANLNSFLLATKSRIKYEYEFSGKIVTTDKLNILKRNYQCYYSINSPFSKREFKTRYYLRNRNIEEKECNAIINSLEAKSKGLLIEYKKYHSYRYDTPMSDGVWAFHCAISISH